MSGISRRKLLSAGTVIGGAALVDAGLNSVGAARQGGHCPGCDADLSIAEMHRANCSFARAVELPEDGEIRPESIQSAVDEQQAAPRFADNSCPKHCRSLGDGDGSDGNYCSGRG